MDEGPQPRPNCREPTDVVRQYTDREIRDLDMSGRQVWLHLEMKQYECLTCRRYFTQRLSWADSGKSYTKRQAKFIFEMYEHQAFTQLAAIVGMHAKCVERLYLEQCVGEFIRSRAAVFRTGPAPLSRTAPDVRFTQSSRVRKIVDLPYPSHTIVHTGR